VARLPTEACDRCHEHFTQGDDLEHFEIAVAVELARLGVCTPAAMRFMRKSLGYGAGELAELLCVAVDAVISWERGSAPLPVHAFVIVGQMARESLDGRGRGNIKDVLRVLADPNRLLPANPIRLMLRFRR